MTRPRPARPESSVERFLLRQPLQLATVELDGSEAHHLLHVLRAKVGDHLGLFNGDGDEALAEIVNIRKRSAELRILEAWTVPPDPRELTLAVALPKGDRARWLIEKATELGVTRIIPLRTQRSVVEPGESKLDKLEQTIIAACKQCGRSRFLRLSPLTAMVNVLKSSVCDLTLIAHPNAPLSVSQAFSRTIERARATLILIGPEGGFTDDEFSSAVASGATPVSLGPFLLRIETAAIAVATGWRLSGFAAHIFEPESGDETRSVSEGERSQ